MQNDFNIDYWNNIKIEIQIKYPFLTESDLLWRDGGTRVDLLKELATRIGISYNELAVIIDDL